jgi:SOS-response transcriptional repressor LexA
MLLADCQSASSKMGDMGAPDQSYSPGSILGIVWAGEPDVDPVMEWTAPESLLDELRVKPTDYFLRVRGFSMKDAGIEEGDLVHVRPVRPGTVPPDGAVVLAEVGLRQVVGERSGLVTIKRFFQQGKTIRLEPANSRIKSQKYQLDDVTIRGVIVNVLRQLSP